jgi:NADH dehydrogenase/NADH:ubiquinone oxidoreductase subunit G
MTSWICKRPRRALGGELLVFSGDACPLVTEQTGIVFPVSLMHERSGTFVNWEAGDGLSALIRPPTIY